MNTKQQYAAAYRNFRIELKNRDNQSYIDYIYSLISTDIERAAYTSFNDLRRPYVRTATQLAQSK